MEELVDYLFARIKQLKSELEQAKRAAAASPQNAPTSVEHGVLRASSTVAKASLQPAVSDLRIHPQGRKLLMKIAADRREDVLELLNSHPSLLEMRDSSKNGFTLLHAAADADASESARALLLDFKMDPLARDLLGRTALHVAAEKLNVDACRVLIEHMPQSSLGVDAPLDAAGVTPAGKTGLVKRKSEKKSQVLRMLHRVGDASISPFKLGSNATSSDSATTKHGMVAMPGYRVNMEDEVVSCALEDRGLEIFAVLDGHGGSLASKVCAQNLRAAFHSQTMNDSSDAIELQEIMSNASWALEEALAGRPEFQLREVSQAPSMSIGNEQTRSTTRLECADPSGTTLTAVVLTSTLIGCVNVGDSRAILLRKSQDEEILLSRDHKPYFDPPEYYSFYVDEKRRVLEAGGEIDVNNYVVVNDRLKLGMTRTLGNFEAKARLDLPREKQMVSAEPDVLVVDRELDNDEFVVLASDGVWDVMESKEVVDFVRLNASFEPKEIANKLVLECLEARGSQDNISVVVVDLKEKGVARKLDISEEETPTTPTAQMKTVDLSNTWSV